MTCTQAQGCITPFIKDQMNINELESFLNHIESCEECKEELEVYYTLLAGMRQLDEEQNMPSDFHVGFLNKLKKAEEIIIQHKVQSFRKRFLLTAIIVVVSFLSSFRIQEYMVDEIEKESYIANAPFEIQYYYFKNRTTELDHFIEEHRMDIIIYKIKDKIDMPESKGDIDE